MKRQILKPCEQCGRTFSASAYEAGRGRARFCSRTCVGNASFPRGADNPNFKVGRIEVTCHRCGVACLRYPSETERGDEVFCSASCRANAFVESIDFPRDPRQGSVHKKVARAIANGLLTKPDTCSDCGRKAERIEGHHDDYAKPLVVRWLCVRCHRLLHFSARFSASTKAMAS